MRDEVNPGYWRFEPTDEGGRIYSLVEPKFSASWSVGDDVPQGLAEGEDLCWFDEGSDGGEDSICFYDICFEGPSPTQEEFELLMQAAARALDGWIASRFL